MTICIDDSILDITNSGPVLRASRCRACGHDSFPVSERCQRCMAEEIEPLAIVGRAQLWTWTSQDFCPKSPYLECDKKPFESYYVGYLNPLNTSVLIESRLLQPGQPVIGDLYELTTLNLLPENGAVVTTFAYRSIAI
ncbi:hypothetical protein HCU74_14525 [Spongiibacter sp. KMU-166]|uniref:DUF35 domain-containing protein n=1 Tax=Spongiibacter thalassae TaxID=2721624 RepID=A0ABX1GHH6_9GAMM|nr:hypothetical protein [Spongiibacter thalassae]NKI18628.1 hypothetical protein [Spongiibacter thalassae]